METTAYLQKKAESGCADAQYRMGHRLSVARPRAPDGIAQAMEFWRKAAKQGHARAYLQLGHCHHFGDGVPVNMKKAIRLYERAVEGGNDEALYRLGKIYLDGEGVKKAPCLATTYLWVAAEKGHDDSQLQLGYCLYHGIGFAKRDFDEAARWYSRAAKQGNKVAQFNLAMCYREGDGVKKSHRWCRYWLEQAAAQMHRRSRQLLKKWFSPEEL